jgi:peptidoglycan/xylan/chitin deacetylase (PgdA/CDA1 family)
MKLPNVVINFHVIQNAEWMDSILKVLMRYYNMVSAKDLEAFYFGGLDLKNACHITVDDGDISVYTHLFPLIKKYNIPISIYVSPMAVMTGRNFWFQEIEGYDLKLFLAYYNKKYNQKHVFKGKYQVYALIKSLELKEIHQLIDGYKQAYGIPDKPRRCMTLEQILELKASGLVDIGAHTIHHPILRMSLLDTVRMRFNFSGEIGRIIG